MVPELLPGAIAIVEYYNAAVDHYFITGDPAEIASLDQSGGALWQRTGHVFYGWADPAPAPPGGARNVCRFYAGPQFRVDSRYFTADRARCAFVLATGGGVWPLQSNAAGRRALPILRPQPSSRTSADRVTFDHSVNSE